jgi:hypothetical protein
MPLLLLSSGSADFWSQFKPIHFTVGTLIRTGITLSSPFLADFAASQPDCASMGLMNSLVSKNPQVEKTLILKLQNSRYSAIKGGSCINDA